jgi:hypothetical protein
MRATTTLIDYMAERDWWLDGDHQDETGRIHAESPSGLIKVTQTDCGWSVEQCTDVGVIEAQADFSNCPDVAVIAFIKALR